MRPERKDAAIETGQGDGPRTHACMGNRHFEAERPGNYLSAIVGQTTSFVPDPNLFLKGLTSYDLYPANSY
jgi:hypothetical protein